MVSHLGLKGILLIAFVYVATQAKAIEKDSIRHWGFTVSVMKSEIIALDKNQRKYLKEKENGSVELELNHINLPSDYDSYAKDYNYRFPIHRFTLHDEQPCALSSHSRFSLG